MKTKILYGLIVLLLVVNGLLVWHAVTMPCCQHHKTAHGPTFQPDPWDGKAVRVANFQYNCHMDCNQGSGSWCYENNCKCDWQQAMKCPHKA